MKLGIEEDKESTAIAEIGRRTQASPTHAHGKEVFLSEAKISFKSRDTINPLTSLTTPKREKRGRRKANIQGLSRCSQFLRSEIIMSGSRDIWKMGSPLHQIDQGISEISFSVLSHSLTKSGEACLAMQMVGHHVH